MPIKRGEIYWVQFSPVKGSEQEGIRPALVVQNDTGNAYSPTTVVVAMTHTLPPRSYPFVVVVDPADSGLPDRGVINCAQIATIQKEGTTSLLRPPKGEQVVRPIGKLSSQKMAEVDAAIKYSLGLV
jgi:mRNA interferase MazF